MMMPTLTSEHRSNARYIARGMIGTTAQLSRISVAVPLMRTSLDRTGEELALQAHRMRLVAKAWRFCYFRMPSDDEMNALLMAAQGADGAAEALQQNAHSPLAARYQTELQSLSDRTALLADNTRTLHGKVLGIFGAGDELIPIGMMPAGGAVGPAFFM